MGSVLPPAASNRQRRIDAQQTCGQERCAQTNKQKATLARRPIPNLQPALEATATAIRFSDFRFPISDFRFPISDFRFPISDFRFPIPDSRFPIS
ncbi:hypothetical protein ABVB18_16645 [Xanthomonas citri pv. mangiferaeindicae]|uniref:hypothetical protein n=1 Tax=Xanthomonas citri TaxID=346 RepID=UPI003F7FEF4E